MTVPAGNRPQPTTPTNAASPGPRGPENVDAARPEVNTGDSDEDEQADDDRPGSGNGHGGDGNGHDDRERDERHWEGGDDEHEEHGGDAGFTAIQERRR